MQLDILYMPQRGFELPVCSTDINRPSLQLTGYFEHFDRNRIQLFGRVEMSYLETLPEEARRAAVRGVFAQRVPLVILARGDAPFPEMIEFAREFSVPLASSQEATSFVISSLNAYLNKELADRITIHGVLVDVYGLGVLLRGDSGIGKSETAIELIKRGHRLVADDAVEIKRVSNITLLGSAPPVIRHFIELRGIGAGKLHHRDSGLIHSDAHRAGAPGAEFSRGGGGGGHEPAAEAFGLQRRPRAQRTHIQPIPRGVRAG